MTIGDRMRRHSTWVTSRQVGLRCCAMHNNDPMAMLLENREHLRTAESLSQRGTMLRPLNRVASAGVRLANLVYRSRPQSSWHDLRH